MTEAPESAERVSAASRLAAKRAAKAAAKAARKGTDAVPARAAAESWKRVGGWADAHRRQVIIAGAAGLVVAAAAILASTQLAARSHGAGAALGAAIDAARGRIVAAGETPPEDALGESFPSAHARAEAALGRYRKVTANDPDSKTAAWGLLGEGNALLELGKADDARKAYARALELGLADPFVQWRAIEGLAFSFEAQGKPEDAMRRFEELATIQKGAYRAAGDYHRARLYAAQGKGDKTLEILDALFEAEKARATSADAPRLAGVLDDARTLRDETAAVLGKPKRDIELGMGAEGASQQQILDALRKQLAGAKSMPDAPPEEKAP